MKLADILKDSNYKLSQFTGAEIEQLEQTITLKETKKGKDRPNTGDGQTNVLHLNTLDYELWDEVTDQEEWDDVYHNGFKRLKRLAQFLVWNAPESVPQKIRRKVEASHQKRKQSKQLLEIAKTGVERAIETDEATAMTWINQQLEGLEVILG